MLTILYFAWVRENIGVGDERIAHPGADVSIAQLIETMRARGDGYAHAFADPSRVRAALDQNFVSLDTALGDAKELALFPPVTGG